MSVCRYAKISFVLISGFVLTGCFGGPSRVAAPEWDVDGITTACMEQADADGDGAITSKEAKENAPSLAYGFKSIDMDQNNELSEEEVRTRFSDLANSKTGVQGFGAKFTFKGRPLPNADVRLVPEAFLDGVIEPAEGTTTGAGEANFDIPGDEYYGVRPGMYRIEVTSAGAKIPAKYNDETTLGVEITPFTNEHETGIIVVKLK